MSENVKNNPETNEKATKKQPVAQATAAAPAAPVETKKENIFVRAKNAVSGWCRKHPALTAFSGAAAGSAVTVAVGCAGKKVLEKKQAEKTAAYIPPQENNNSLDPNS